MQEGAAPGQENRGGAQFIQTQYCETGVTAAFMQHVEELGLIDKGFHPRGRRPRSLGEKRPRWMAQQCPEACTRKRHQGFKGA